ncbi:spondin domain-containing protein [Agarivorans sp. 1_MG-2023]|uniref:spondin domain-containing protein n=1 Tax=Agarivorans sp. 1_MG-2023 TaxID=3062634 RepID=UPI0026E2D405|nr:spondin domain-containing protein [Agarivorans sp. 1_MG-2023]MDO6765660.1 spondin domain-containing protein [Agarivorans sp. 1_MG-2023]
MDLKSSLLAMPLIAVSTLSQAAVVDVKITNLTQGIYYTPLLVTAHTSDAHLFEVGQTASSALQAMAEGGDISGLQTIADGISAVSSANPAGGLLAPTEYAMVSDLDTGSNTHLSIVAMLLPTNDGFVGKDSWEIPSEAGTYTFYMNGYDAGTEANDEIVNGGGMSGVPGIPANPGMNGGTGGSGVATASANSNIHIHPGNVGDQDAAGGMSDLDSRIHRWLNPVAKVVVTVK